MKLCLVVIVLLFCVGSSQAQHARAACDMKPNPSLSPSDPLYQDIQGTVSFIQQVANGSVDIIISLTGFNATDGLKTHGFHVHEFGDIEAGCEDAGGHFNPYGNKHGAPTDTNRHVGDLGNIDEDGSGNVEDSKSDNLIKFDGTSNITGRAIVIHETFDDLGLGNFSDSNTTGHAGARLACCVIVVPVPSQQGNGAIPLASSLMTSLLLILSAIIFLRLE